MEMMVIVHAGSEISVNIAGIIDGRRHDAAPGIGFVDQREDLTVLGEAGERGL